MRCLPFLFPSLPFPSFSLSPISSTSFLFFLSVLSSPLFSHTRLFTTKRLDKRNFSLTICLHTSSDSFQLLPGGFSLFLSLSLTLLLHFVVRRRHVCCLLFSKAISFPRATLPVPRFPLSLVPTAAACLRRRFTKKLLLPVVLAGVVTPIWPRTACPLLRREYINHPLYPLGLCAVVLQLSNHERSLATPSLRLSRRRNAGSVWCVMPSHLLPAPCPPLSHLVRSCRLLCSAILDHGHAAHPLCP